MFFIILFYANTTKTDKFRKITIPIAFNYVNTAKIPYRFIMPAIITFNIAPVIKTITAVGYMYYISDVIRSYFKTEGKSAILGIILEIYIK